MTDLVITRGLPGSGKTTYAEAWKALVPGRQRISRDDLRHAMFGVYSGLTNEQEQQVTQVQHDLLRAWLKGGVDVCVDDTNLNMKTVKALQKIAQECGAEFRNVDFPLAWTDCVERVDKRVSEGGRHVPDSVIADMHHRYLRKGFTPIKPLPTPPICEPYVPDLDKPPAFIVDMDGTLTMGPHERSPYEWAKVGQDQVRQATKHIVNALWDMGYQILIVSGRDGSCEQETNDWLDDQGVHADFLYMRDKGDMRPDNFVKAEIFDKEIRHNFNVLGVLDDRDSVVALWRSLGLTCFQAAPGTF